MNPHSGESIDGRRLVAGVLIGLSIGGLWNDYPKTLLTAFLVVAALLLAMRPRSAE